MLAKLTICAWSMYLGVDLKEMGNIVETGRAVAHLIVLEREIAGTWGIVEKAWVDESANAVVGENGVRVRLIAIEKQIIKATNVQRAQYGLPPLEADPDLMTTARDHCAWMTNNEALQHTSLPVAENIAMGQPSPDHVLQTWMGSSGHRANILNGAFRRIGVAAYQTPRGIIFWCQQFRGD